jgi:TonB family protein
MKKSLLILCILCFYQLKAQQKDENTELMQQIGIRTARQTWWFFDKRLKTPIDYAFQHVYIKRLDVYIQNIRKLPDGKYTGIVNLNLPHNIIFTENNQEITFDSAEIDDWFMVQDTYLVGGFYLRTLPFAEKQQVKKEGYFNYGAIVINDDFIESTFDSLPSKTMAWPEEDHSYFIGGQKALLDSLQQKLYYSNYARLMGIEGRVLVNFTIKKDGGLSHVKVIRGVGGGLNDIARDMIYELSSCFRPPFVDGEPIDFTFTLPIVFKLN